MPVGETDVERGDEHQVTPLELFFDLVFVFAITHVTSLLASDSTWGGVLRGLLVLTALWWAWTTYASLTSAIDVDERAFRLAMLASTAAMLVARGAARLRRRRSLVRRRLPVRSPGSSRPLGRRRPRRSGQPPRSGSWS
jgi:hypothetical protein